MADKSTMIQQSFIDTMIQESFIDTVIDKLKDADISGEAMEYIIREVNLEHQILRQLILKADDQDLDDLLEERASFNEPSLAYYDKASTTTYEVNYKGERYYVECTRKASGMTSWTVRDDKDKEQDGWLTNKLIFFIESNYTFHTK